VNTLRSGDESLPPAVEGEFSLGNVCWGYRDLFADALRDLETAGLIGEGREEVTRELIEFLKRAESNDCFAHVLKEFLLGLNRRTRWIMKLPGIFSDVVDMGRRLAEKRIGYGITYFTLFGQGEFGDKPAHIRSLMRWLRRLDGQDAELALAFLRYHRQLVERLTPDETDLYINEGLALYARNHRHGVRFMAGEVKGSDRVVRSLSQECRLSDMRSELAVLVRALTGRDIEVDDLSTLDTDELIARGTRFVCLPHALYVPARIRDFGTVADNRAWFMLQAVVAAGSLSHDSFPVVHGHPSFASMHTLSGESLARCTLFQLVEYLRVFDGMRRDWPGSRRLLQYGVEAERRLLRPANAVEELLFECLDDTVVARSPVAQRLRALAGQPVNFFGTAALLTDAEVGRCTDLLPELEGYGLRPRSFLPDFGFHVELSNPPSDAVVADLRESARRPRPPGDEPGGAARQRTGDGERRAAGDTQGPEAGLSDACYLYDEWSEAEGDYYANYCRVHELQPACAVACELPEGLSVQAAKVRRVFELLKPDASRYERYLEDGDSIDTDLLVRFLADRRREPSPRVDFYRKPRIRERDMALLVLLDVSGSTGESGCQERFIDIQNQAALIMGEGLESLGDRFAVCGFSGSGRENCEYFVYKDFDDAWDRQRKGRVMAATPRSSTRMGPALRHSGYRLRRVDAHRRLVMLISDGRPTDSGYDPNTRYAQYDVRMACAENRRQGVHTFCITTNENSVADMQIMFPDGNYAILPHIRRLPHTLPRLYLKITT
jgi:hypothetical protein